MEYRNLGTSGLRVPVLSFGTGTFGGQGPLFSDWGRSDASEARRLIDICLEAGVNLFDTADVYSNGASEEILGAAIKGRGLCFVDLSVAFSRYGSPAVQPPAPFFSTIEWLKSLLDDPSTSFVKAWANLMAQSISKNRKQPVEVAGDDKAKEIAFRLLNKVGFTPCDCGGCADVPKIEPGFHERRWKHPTHLAFNGANHP